MAKLNGGQTLPKSVWPSGVIMPPPTAFAITQILAFFEDLGYKKTVKALRTEATSNGVDLASPEVEALRGPFKKSLGELYADALLHEDDSDEDSDSSEDEEDEKAGGAGSDAESSSDDSSVSSESDSESDSDSDKAKPAVAKGTTDDSSDDSSDDSEDEKPQVTAETTALKRKRDDSSSDSSSSESSSDSSSDSSSEDEAPPAKKSKTSVITSKKAKIVAKPTSPSVSSSDSSSDSDSADSSSDSDTSSDSSDDSDSEMGDAEKGKVPAPKSKTPDSESSSVTLAASPVKEENNGDIHPSRAGQMNLPGNTPTDKTKKGSVPFSRIPKDTVVDPRFSSNAYVSYDYADRAHQDLIITKGKGFTKEKNKKKRGSYRGGQIDFTPKGIKFDD